MTYQEEKDETRARREKETADGLRESIWSNKRVSMRALTDEEVWDDNDIQRCVIDRVVLTADLCRPTVDGKDVKYMAIEGNEDFYLVYDHDEETVLAVIDPFEPELFDAGPFLA